MKKLLTLVLVALLALAVVACSKLGLGKKAEAPPPTGPATTTTTAATVGGTYAGAGTNPDGSSYKCDVEIKPAGKVYQVMWYFDGKPGYEGMGILKGNTFTVGFANNAGYGVVAYTVNADGSLDGTWSGKGARTAGAEKLTKK